MENALLRREAADLHQHIMKMERIVPDPTTFVREPDLRTVHEFLDRAGYAHDYRGDREHIFVDYVGRHTAFRVAIRLFDGADVLFLSTANYFSLDDAAGTDSVVMLMVQLATLNYELLLGKFQLDPRSGDVLLSVEIPVADGLGFDTFAGSMEHLVRTADGRYPELARAAAGRGL